MVGWVGVVGWGGLLVLYLKDVIAERQYSSMVFHGDSIEIFHSLRCNIGPRPSFTSARCGGCGLSDRFGRRWALWCSRRIYQNHHQR